MKKVSIILTSAILLAFTSCETKTKKKTTQKVIEVGELISYKDIPEGYYDNTQVNRDIDPYNELLEVFRQKKIKDLASPNFPKPFNASNIIPSEFIASGSSWTDLEEVFQFDWDNLKYNSSEEVQALKKSVKARLILNHPDVKIVELAIGAGGILPKFKKEAPSVLHAIGGKASVQVGENTCAVTTGVSVKIEPNTTLRIEANNDEPVKFLYLSWAPGGQQDYLDAGYYLTGTNFYAQPLEATMPNDFEFWNDATRSKVQPNGAEAKNGLYNETPVFSSELDVPWIDFTNLEGEAFFWAKDASTGGDLLKSWNKIVRMKGIFQAKVPGKQFDLNFSYISNGPHGKYATHSHATPEFYYVLGGNVEWIIDGTEYRAKAGNIYFHPPYQDHEMLGLADNTPMLAITGSWAPYGDRTVFVKEFTLMENLPSQVESSFLPNDYNFHNFNLKTGLKYPEKQ